MSSFRPERVGEQIHKEITRLLMHGVKDPRVALVTITGVSVTRDLRLAKVFFSVAGEDEERKNAERGLKSAAAYIRRELGQVMRLRHTPDIRFEYDGSIAYGNKIETLLRQVRDDLHDDPADS